MARNGTAEVATVDDLYDSLSQDAKDHWDEIGSLGFTPFKGVKGDWWARKTGTEDTGDDIGPSESISVLVQMVCDAPKSNDDHPDGVLFEEMRAKRQIVIPELRIPILNWKAFQDERIAALAKEVEAKKEVDRLMHQHKAMLAFDPKTGVHSYSLNDEVAVDLAPGEEKLKLRKINKDDEEF